MVLKQIDRLCILDNCLQYNIVTGQTYSSNSAYNYIIYSVGVDNRLIDNNTLQCHSALSTEVTNDDLLL